MILEDTVEPANATLKVDALNEKSALGLISSRKSDKSNIL